jgi:hypothetical protein
MPKYLQVDIERNLAGCDVTEYIVLDGGETDADLSEIAAGVFANYCTYGYVVVDESEVPDDER